MTNISSGYLSLLGAIFITLGLILIVLSINFSPNPTQIDDPCEGKRNGDGVYYTFDNKCFKVLMEEIK